MRLPFGLAVSVVIGNCTPDISPRNFCNSAAPRFSDGDACEERQIEYVDLPLSISVKGAAANTAGASATTSENSFTVRLLNGKGKRESQLITSSGAYSSAISYGSMRTALPPERRTVTGSSEKFSSAVLPLSSTLQ